MVDIPKDEGFMILATSTCQNCAKAEMMLLMQGETPKIKVMEQKVLIAMGFREVPQIYHNGVHIGGYMKTKKYIEDLKKAL